MRPKRRRVDSDSDDDRPLILASHSSAKPVEDSTVTAAQIERKAKQLLAECATEFPLYSATLRRINIETSARMTSSAAKCARSTRSLSNGDGRTWTKLP